MVAIAQIRLGLTTLSLLVGFVVPDPGQLLAQQTAGAPQRREAASPSDQPRSNENRALQAAPQPAQLSPAPPVQMELSDSSPQAQIQPVPIQPVPRTSAPNVASLGDRNRYSSLTRAPVYSSPFVSMVGVGATAGNAPVASYFSSSAHRSLLQTPEMFGDFRRPGSSILVDQFATAGSSAGYYPPDDNFDNVRPTDFPTAASFSGLRISENNYALPQDRFWVGYNHMHNAFAQPGGDLTLDRFVFGVEKTFQQGSSSLEVRLPVAASLDGDSSFGGTTEYSSGDFGNLSLIFKKVLYADDRRVVAYGLGVETPTGSQSSAYDDSLGPVAFSVDPSAVYLAPYIGSLRTFSDLCFSHGFLQLDLPTSGDTLNVSLNNGPVQQFKLNQPITLELDFGFGIWIVSPDRLDPAGLALTTELHLATALSDGDVFAVDPTGAFPNLFVNEADSITTLLNSTTGVHANFGNGWSIRTGIAVPLLRQRIFDTEALVQVNRRY